MKTVFARIWDFLASLWGMNTVARQTFWLVLLFAIAYPILKRVQKPRSPDPFNEPVPKPVGGIHCLLLGEAAVHAYERAWPELTANDAAIQRSGTSSTLMEKVLGGVEDAERECSVASSDRERQGIQEMRKALGRVRQGLSQRPVDGAAHTEAAPGHEEISVHIARARELLR
jgi:hypothetical protein